MTEISGGRMTKKRVKNHFKIAILLETPLTLHSQSTIYKSSRKINEKI